MGVRYSFVVPSLRSVTPPSMTSRYRQPQPNSSAKVTKVDSQINILTIDSIIKSNFEKDIGSIDDMKNDVMDYLSIIMFSPYQNEKDQAQKQSDILSRRIKGIQFGVGLTGYLLKTTHLIESYKKIVPRVRKAYGAKIDVEQANNTQKIVLDFLKIAREYIDLENFVGLQSGVEPCPECNSTNFQKTEEFGITVCECGLAIEILNVAPSYNDSKRVNCSTRFKHNAKGYLEEAIDDWECKQGIISQTTLAIVKEEMKARGMEPHEVTKDDIHSWLTVKKLSESYADINAIYCAITGKPPPDLSKYRAELLEMSAQFEPVCKRLISDRTNALTVLWKLYMFLCLLDYPCSREDFYCLKTTVKQEEHQAAWDLVIGELIKLHPTDKTSNGKARWRDLKLDRHVSYKRPS